MSETNDRWLSVDEICERLGVDKDTVYEWINNRGMPAYRKGGRLWKFNAKRVDEWLENRGETSG